jgi:3-deoxy-7-phosphoheptulonate synthase
MFDMRILLSPDATAREVGEVLRLAREAADRSDEVRIDTRDGQMLISVTANGESVDPAMFERLAGVESVEDARPIYRLAGVDRPEVEHAVSGRTLVEVPYAGVTIGSGQFVVMAGPCAVENEQDILATARRVRSAGARILRGGASRARESRVWRCSRGRERKWASLL